MCKEKVKYRLLISLTQSVLSLDLSWFQTTIDFDIDHSIVILTYPLFLTQEIINYNCRDLIESVPFLREGGPEFVTEILNRLSFEVFLAGDYIVREGTYGNQMFFIRAGTVDIEAEGYFISSLYEGEYFGGMFDLILLKVRVYPFSQKARRKLH